MDKIEIKAAQNGFIVEYDDPAIEKANEASESGWKDPETYKVYTDPKQIIKDIEAMLPMLTSGEKEQSDFEAAFGKPTE